MGNRSKDETFFLFLLTVRSGTKCCVRSRRRANLTLGTTKKRGETRELRRAACRRRGVWGRSNGRRVCVKAVG